MRPNAAESHDPRPEYFRELIASTGMTQKKIAEALGVSERGIRMWLNGDRPITYPVQYTLEALVLEP